MGWASNGMNAQKATKLRAEIVQNIKEGISPQSLREKRELENTRREEGVRQKKSEERNNFTFGQLAERYLTWSQENKRSSNDDVQRYNKHLKALLTHKTLKDISPFLLEKLKDNLSQKYITVKDQKKNKQLSPATIRHCLALVRQMFNKATAWGLYAGQNPIMQVKLPSIRNRGRLRFLSHDEADRLLLEVGECSSVVHDQAILSLHCGLRFGEIARLTLSDLDFTHGIIQIRDPKGESRQAYMTKQVKNLLLTRKPAKPPDFVFPDRNGNRAKAISDAYERAVVRLGFNAGITDPRDRVVFHTLRHTFASWLALQGTPIFTIKELMGHKSLAMTERYAHLMPNEKIAAVKMLAGIFEGKREQNGESSIVTEGR